MRSCLLLVPLLGLATTALAGCGTKSSNGYADDGGLFADAGFLGGDGGTAGGCSDAAKLVYVVSDSNDLYSFHPDTLTFTKVGSLQCPVIGAQPNSMAIDRTGTAWVGFSDGTLYKASTADASCQSTAFKAGQHGFGRFGMAFSSDSAGSSDETLFVSGLVDVTGGVQGQGLAKIDLKTFVLTPIGDFSGALAGKAAELTGTGDGKLYGFFTTQPAQLAEIDKATGATKGARPLTGVSTGTHWAFSFWGGDFWFYTADIQGKSPFDTTDVTRLKSATDGSLGVVKSQIGFRIVGAGVSTCAPTAPPK